MLYEYKTVALSQCLVVKEGQDLGKTIATLIEKITNEMANEGWEYYRSESYVMKENLGCLSALFGKEAKERIFNVLVFRKEK